MRRICKWVLPGEREVPSVVKKRVHGLYLLSAGMGVAGSLFLLLTGLVWMIPFCLLFAMIVGAFGYSQFWTASRKGCAKVEGECVKVVYPISSGALGLRPIPKAFQIQDAESGIVYSLPCYKRGDLAEVGDCVTLYVPNGVFTYERGGITYFSEIWGYEVVPARQSVSSEE